MRFWLTCMFFSTLAFGDLPSWFGSLPNTNAYEIIGYGEGKTLEEAKTNAKNDIAKTISSHIKSSFITQISVKNDSVDHRAQEKISETTDLSLSNVKIVQKEMSDGKVFVALSYEILPLWSKLVQLGGKSLCGEANPYLMQTPLLQNISRELNCSVAVAITRDNNQWYLGHNEHRSILTQNELQKLMIETSSKALHVSITADQAQVKEDESYTLHLNNIPKKGYLSLFDLYDDGRVVLMEKNIDLAKLRKTALHYPNDLRDDFELTGGVVEMGKDTLDLYIIIISNEPLKLSNFATMGENIERSDFAFAFDKLIFLMQNNLFSSTLITTKAKKVTQ